MNTKDTNMSIKMIYKKETKSLACETVYFKV